MRFSLCNCRCNVCRMAVPPPQCADINDGLTALTTSLSPLVTSCSRVMSTSCRCRKSSSMRSLGELSIPFIFSVMNLYVCCFVCYANREGGQSSRITCRFRSLFCCGSLFARPFLSVLSLFSLSFQCWIVELSL